MAYILLVDDEKIARALYGDYLAQDQHQVTVVESLHEAQAALLKTKFDLVVTDLILPVGDGMDVLQFVKSNHPDIEVIVITGMDKVVPAVRALQSGAAEYLVKPIEPEVLKHAVGRALATRALLRENHSLRQYVSLMETGQRISTTLDREHLAQIAGTSFHEATAADAVAIFWRQGTKELFKMEGTFGLDEVQKDALAAGLSGPLDKLAPGTLEIETLPAPFKRGMLLPALEGQFAWGAAALLFKQPPHENALTSALFLANHLGLALRNLGRFSAVEDLAYLDDLTHLFNTRYLEMALEREVAQSKESQRAFSLLFLDLDYFKSVNDNHGHLVGSKLLVEVARILKRCIRDNDVAARYGGDEYVILLHSTDSGGALKVAERIRRTMETHHFLAREGYALSITTCIGIASFPEHAQDKAALLDLADRAMYRGKRSTRNVIYMAAKGLEATPSARRSTPTGKPKSP